jgi:FG-GAP repeat
MNQRGHLGAELVARWTSRLLAGAVALEITATAAAQCIEEKLVASDGRAGDQFGFAVALDGTTAAIGAPFASTAHGPTGVVYVYELGDEGWRRVQQLEPPGSAEMRFGHSIDISGRWMVVGAPDDDSSYYQRAGAAYVFERSPTGWKLNKKLEHVWAKQDERLGQSVAVDGGWLITGVPWWDLFGSHAGPGDALIWHFDGEWKFEETLFAGGFENGPWLLGYSVDISGTIAIAGAPNAYVPVVSAGGWVMVKYLGGTSLWETLPNPGVAGDRFGHAVSICGDRLLIGAPLHADPLVSSGAVYAYGMRGPAHVPPIVMTQKILYPEPATQFFNNCFGSSLDMTVDKAIIGASAPLGGSVAYIYRFNAGRWVPEGKLSTDGLSSNQWQLENNQVVALDGDRAMQGLPSDDDLYTMQSNTGAVLASRLGDGATSYCTCTQGACGNPTSWGGCWNSTVHGALLQACGSPSVLEDDLELQARWLPPEELGVVIMGPRPDELPFGDGVLCVGPGDLGLFRFPVLDSGASGVIELGPGIVAQTQASFPVAGHIQAGDTWYFQAWYRDPDGPCGTGFNLTNGLRVEFTQ